MSLVTAYWREGASGETVLKDVNNEAA
jgi:hypothetical protein